MQLIDVAQNETEEQAEARTKAAPKSIELPIPKSAEVRASGFVDADYPEVSEGGGWSIDSITSLDWALGRRAALEREQAENAAIVQRQIDWLQMRLEKLNATAQRGVEFFTRKIGEYAEEHRAELLGGGEKKSRALPHGVVGWKKRPAKATATDKDALLAWAKEKPIEEGWVRTKEEAAWDRIKAHVEETGEDVPGVDLQPETEELTIKPIGDV